MSCSGNCSGCGKDKVCSQPCGIACANEQCGATCTNKQSVITIQPSNLLANQPMGGIGASYRMAIRGLRTGSITPISMALVVDEIVAGGPADRAGLLAADTVIKVDGNPVQVSAAHSVEDVVAQIQGAVGTTVEVTIERAAVGGQALELSFSIVRAISFSSGSPAFFVGVPKCRACPIQEQPGKCADCPNPVRVAMLAAKAAHGQKRAESPADSYPTFVQDVLARSQEVPVADGPAQRAIKFTVARLAYNAALRGLAQACARFEHAAEGELDEAFERLTAAEERLEQAIKVYDAANRVLDAASGLTKSAS